MKAFVNSTLLNIMGNSKSINIFNARPIKNFGHKRVPVPLVTTLWHGFLTFTFIGLMLKWDKFKMMIFGDATEIDIDEPIQSNDVF